MNEDDLLSELMSDTKLNKPAAAAASQSSALETDWNDVKDSFIQDDDWTQSFFQQQSKTKVRLRVFVYFLSLNEFSVRVLLSAFSSKKILENLETVTFHAMKLFPLLFRP